MPPLLIVLAGLAIADLLLFIGSCWWGTRQALRLYREGRSLSISLGLLGVAKRWKLNLTEAWRRL